MMMGAQAGPEPPGTQLTRLFSCLAVHPVPHNHVTVITGMYQLCYKRPSRLCGNDCKNDGSPGRVGVVEVVGRGGATSSLPG